METLKKGLKSLTIYYFSCFLPIETFPLQIQLWLSNPREQLIIENVIPNIEAPYNGMYTVPCRVEEFCRVVRNSLSFGKYMVLLGCSVSLK